MKTKEELMIKSAKLDETISSKVAELANNLKDIAKAEQEKNKMHLYYSAGDNCVQNCEACKTPDRCGNPFSSQVTTTLSIGESIKDINETLSFSDLLESFKFFAATTSLSSEEQVAQIKRIGIDPQEYLRKCSRQLKMQTVSELLRQDSPEAFESMKKAGIIPTEIELSDEDVEKLNNLFK